MNPLMMRWKAKRGEARQARCQPWSVGRPRVRPVETHRILCTSNHDGHQRSFPFRRYTAHESFRQSYLEQASQLLKSRVRMVKGQEIGGLTWVRHPRIAQTRSFPLARRRSRCRKRHVGCWRMRRTWLDDKVWEAWGWQIGRSEATRLNLS